MFSLGKFQVLLNTEEEARSLFAAGLRVTGRPTLLHKWSATGLQNLSSLDVALYWVLLPGLPPQCLESLKDIGNALSTFVSSEKTWEEMLKHLQAFQADQRTYNKLFSGESTEDRITFKVCLVLQHNFWGVPEAWMSQDRQQGHFPGVVLERLRLWNKSRAQQEAEAREALGSVLQTVSGYPPSGADGAHRSGAVHDSLEQLQEGWLLCIFCRMGVSWDELPSTMTWR